VIAPAPAPEPGARWVDLESDPAAINPQAARCLPGRVCRHFEMLPIAFDGDVLTVAMAEPSAGLPRSVAFALTKLPIDVVAADRAALRRAIDRHHHDAEGPTVNAPGAGAQAARTAREELEAGARAAEQAGEPLLVSGRLGSILVEHGAISPEELAEALAEQRRAGGRLGEALRSGAGLDERDLAAALADQAGIPLLDLEGVDPAPEALALIPPPVLEEARAIPLALDEHTLYVAVNDPYDESTDAVLRRMTGRQIRRFLATPSDLQALGARLDRDAESRQHAASGRRAGWVSRAWERLRGGGTARTGEDPPPEH
jgi:hypothetical protein